VIVLAPFPKTQGFAKIASNPTTVASHHSHQRCCDLKQIFVVCLDNHQGVQEFVSRQLWPVRERENINFKCKHVLISLIMAPQTRLQARPRTPEPESTRLQYKTPQKSAFFRDYNRNRITKPFTWICESIGITQKIGNNWLYQR